MINIPLYSIKFQIKDFGIFCINCALTGGVLVKILELGLCF